MKWLFKVELKDKNIFEIIEKNRSVKLSEEFKNFVIRNNAASPKLTKIVIDDTERIFAAVLSFNKGAPDNIYTALKCVDKKSVVPFAIDPFGNYFCYDAGNEKVCFLEHETDKIICSDIGIGGLEDALH